MSILSLLDRNEFSNIDKILDAYKIEIKDWKSHLIIDGKNIEKANIEQMSHLAFYDEIKVELKSLLDFFDMKVKQVRGEVLSYIIKNSRLDLQERARERMIDSDPKYIKIYEIYLNVKELYNKLESIVENFRDRAWVLDRLVKIRIASLQDVTLFL